jgi:flagellar motor switch protein FliG
MSATPAIPQPRALSGSERAAIVLLSVGPEQASRLVELLSEEEIRQISKAMARLGEIDASIAKTVVQEFAARTGNAGSIVGSQQTTERLLRATMIGKDELVDTIMQDIRGGGGAAIWDKIVGMDAKVFANFLQREHPQTAAVVLSRVVPDFTAQVLAALGTELASTIMLRMLEIEKIEPEVIEDIERGLWQDLQPMLQTEAGDDRHAFMADLIGRVDSDTEARLLGAIESDAPDQAAQVRKHMFTFIDIAKMQDSGIQTLLNDVDKARLAVAIKLADEAMQNVFLRNMSERQAKLLRDELQMLNNVRKADAETAQREIVLLAKALAAAGSLQLRPPEDETPAEEGTAPAAVPAAEPVAVAAA